MVDEGKIAECGPPGKQIVEQEVKGTVVHST